MSSLKEIRTRIHSVINTKQITRAMKMVSAAKLKKYQGKILDLRPYSHALLRLIYELSEDHQIKHPLLRAQDNKERLLMVVISGDRGLCGGFNAHLNKSTLKFYEEFSNEYQEVDLVSIGKKSQEFLKKSGVSFTQGVSNLSNEVNYEIANKVAREMILDVKKYSRVVFVYNEFKSALSQEVVSETIFPVTKPVALRNDPDLDFAGYNFIFEPKPENILDELLSKHFSIQIYRCFLESVTAEHAARMNAMENATNNATDMVNSLKLSYNKLRQAAITTELSEICSGAEALK